MSTLFIIALWLMRDFTVTVRRPVEVHQGDIPEYLSSRLASDSYFRIGRAFSATSTVTAQAQSMGKNSSMPYGSSGERNIRLERPEKTD